MILLFGRLKSQRKNTRTSSPFFPSLSPVVVVVNTLALYYNGRRSRRFGRWYSVRISIMGIHHVRIRRCVFPVTELPLVGKLNLLALFFSRVRWYPIWVCQFIPYPLTKCWNHTLGIGMTQGQLEESSPWKIGWWRLGHSNKIYPQVLELPTITSQLTAKVLWLVHPEQPLFPLARSHTTISSDLF